MAHRTAASENPLKTFPLTFLAAMKPIPLAHVMQDNPFPILDTRHGPSPKDKMPRSGTAGQQSDPAKSKPTTPDATAARALARQPPAHSIARLEALASAHKSNFSHQWTFERVAKLHDEASARQRQCGTRRDCGSP